MEELRIMLKNVPDSYEDFVIGMINYASYSEDRKQRLTEYLRNNPGVGTASIIRYISDQPDFYDDASEDNEALAVTA